ncbi:MAG: hypothetical protein LIP08_01110, partial [Bacteroides sp.]|nr:hypothetical protein [Bacteroides sp.]
VYPIDGSTIIGQINNQITVKFTKPGTYVVTCGSGSSCISLQTPIVKTITVTQNDLKSMY